MTKTNIRKRAISILLILMVMLTMMPMTASAEEPEWTTVNSFDELKEAMQQGTKTNIKLGKDINTNDEENHRYGLTPYDTIRVGNTITLDLNGKKLTLNSGNNRMSIYIRVVSGSLTVQNSVSGGEIFLNDEYKGGSSLMQVEPEATFTLKSGTLRATTPKPRSNGITLIENHGTVNIEGGTLTCTQKDGSLNANGQLDDWSSCYALLSQSNSGSVQTTISGGTFTGYVEVGVNNKGKQSTISGGTFNNDTIFKLSDEKNMTWTAPGLTISGGTFKGETSLKGLCYHEKSTDIAAIISGGTFDSLKVVMLRVWVIDYELFKQTYEAGGRDLSKATLKQGYAPYQFLGGTYGDLHFGNAIYPECDPILERTHKAFRQLLRNGGIKVGDTFYPFFDIEKAILEYGSSGDFDVENPNNETITVIPDVAMWGMKSVTLDGTEINYAKDWNGTFERMDNSTAHTLKFEWYPLAQELKDAGYSYNAKCEHYISGSSAVQQTDTIAADKTTHTVTIEKGADPKVYSFDLHLNLKKDSSSVGIFSNEHIVKLVVNEAPAAPPTLSGKVYYTSGIVYNRPISTAASVTPAEATKSYQWQRRMDSGSTWENIADATSGQYTPVAADMGENVRIRVKITAEGYLGEIVGAPVKVSKAANDNTPAPPAVEAQKDDSGAYTKFVISEFNSSNQEYVYTTSAPTSGSEWPTGGTEITSATVKNLTAGSTYYIYTRYKESDTHTAGSKISSSSVLLDEITKLNRIILTDASGKVYSSYGNGNTIYIQKGTSMTLNVTKNPVGANKWSAFTFKSQYGTVPFTVTDPTSSVVSGSTISSVTIHGDTKGEGTLVAEYGGYTPQYYGTWRVHVYENISDIGTGAEITVSTSFPDTTMYVGDTMTLPEYTVTAYPEGALANYNLAWRIIKTSSTGFAHLTQDDNIELVDGKLKAKAAHTGSNKTRLELVTINKNDNTIKSLSPLAGFYVTVTEAPTIALTGITVAPKKVNLDINGTITLSAVKQPVNADGILSWASDNPTVAEVDSTTGKVTAKAQGTAKITATCGTESASCTVTVDHTHDYNGQPYLYLDPGSHYQECKTGDDFKMEAHDFTAWAEVNGTNNHSRTCSKCKDPIAKSINYSETAAHTWVWVVDTPAAAGVAGKKHEKCTGCNATRNVDTVIPALPNHAASGGGSYAPTTQKPEITIIGSGKAELSADGKTATITAAAGYELASVVLNGKEMGKVEKLTGLKTGDKVTITFRAKAGEKDGKEETDKMIAREVSKLRLTARSARTAKKNVKLVVKSDLKAITDAGYTVKYKFYRSTKKSAGYKAVLTKKAPTYVNTYGKKGTLYYYKVKVMVYDKDGNLIAQTALKQCKYASRLWTK